MEQVYVAIKKHMHKSFEGPQMVKKKKLLMCCERAPGIQRCFVKGPTPDAHDGFRVLMMGLGPRFSHPKASRPALTLNRALCIMPWNSRALLCVSMGLCE